MTWKPEVTVAAVLEREQRFLLVEERIRGRQLINQPAGHLEHGESLLAAAVRETREETGWLFEPRWLIGVYLMAYPGSQRSTLRFAFTGELLSHDAGQKLDAPVVRTHWWTRAELSAQRASWRTPLVMRCVDDFLAGRRIELGALAHLGGD